MVLDPVEPRTVALNIPARPLLPPPLPSDQVLDHAPVVLLHRLTAITDTLRTELPHDRHGYLDAMNAVAQSLNAALLDHRYAVVRGEFTPPAGTRPQARL